jgi:hypothetical protein
MSLHILDVGLLNIFDAPLHRLVEGVPELNWGSLGRHLLENEWRYKGKKVKENVYMSVGCVNRCSNGREVENARLIGGEHGLAVGVRVVHKHEDVIKSSAIGLFCEACVTIQLGACQESFTLRHNRNHQITPCHSCTLDYTNSRPADFFALLKYRKSYLKDREIWV